MCFHETGCWVWIEIAHEVWLTPIPSFSWQLSAYILMKFDSAANSNAGCSCGRAFQQCPPTSPSLCGMLQVPADVRTVLSCSLLKAELAMLLGQFAVLGFFFPLPFEISLLECIPSLVQKKIILWISFLSQVAWQLFSKAVEDSFSRGLRMSNHELLCSFCLSICVPHPPTHPFCISTSVTSV